MPARILVIEDNAENLELMTYLLKAFHHTVFTACDGEEGMEVARRELPDLILCDLQMPKLDGYGVARALRNDPRLAKHPLVAVTAYAMRGDRDLVLAAGFTGYISKPISPEEFVGQVEHFLKPQGQVSPKPRYAILVVDNSPVNLSLMQSTLEPFGYEVVTVGTVKEALAAARHRPPDLILSDLHMPEIDGYGFLSAVKLDPALREIPFAIISSTVWRDTDPGVALGLGADKFILRPIDPQELVDQIEACLSTSSKGKVHGHDFSSR